MNKNKKKGFKKVRLPQHISPIQYDLTIHPDLESRTFSGKEIIKINIKKQTKSITLHSKDIDIETAKLTFGKKEYFAKIIKYNKSEETATFLFSENIRVGRASLALVFSGIINDHLRGFYVSKYKVNDKQHYIGTTQFEATDARRAFPSFDEPAHKAIFEISLIIKEEHKAISNTLPIHIAEHEAGYKIVKFAPTPKMSTYLVAFVFGDFEYIEGHTKDNIQVRIYTTKGKKHQAKFALDVAIRSLQFYNDYFKIPYPLPTLDLIAIPDFESAAMENWGAVTFRETALLVDEEKSSLSNKQWVAIVIAHELAHQWFGNLVTMHWWTDLWLNEGFASYMENFCIDKLFPEWDIWNLYLADRYTLALRLDSLFNSHPIEVTVNHPNEINEIFDMVSYAKGSAVIRMLAEYIGENKFRDGLRDYLKKHSYKNTKTVDLWKSFENVSRRPITKMMMSWTRQTGYPIVKLIKNKNHYNVTQERFFSSRITRKNNGGRQTWHIPLSYDIGKREYNILLSNKTNKLPNGKITKINKSEKSFIRTCYSHEDLKYLGNMIIENKLNTKDRLGLIRDIFSLAEAGYIKTSEALEFSLYYKNESEYIVWSELSSGVDRVYNIIHDKNFANIFKIYARSLYQPLFERIGFDKIKGEKHDVTFLRTLSISKLAYYEDKNIIKKSFEIYKQSSQNPIKSDIRGVIYSIIAQNSGEKEFYTFKKMYQKEEMQEEKERLGRALSSFKNQKILMRTLAMSLGDDVRKQDAPFIIGSVWQNISGRRLAFKFIRDNWDIIVKRYGEGGHFLSRLITPLGNHTDKSDLKIAERFFMSNKAPGADRAIKQIYEKMKSNIAWQKDDLKDIENWLNNNYGNKKNS